MICANRGLFVRSRAEFVEDQWTGQQYQRDDER
jgi:hypothetical protein